MSIQLSTAVRNAQANAIETTVGTAPIIEIFTGSPPANCAAADSGTKVASGTLPSDWLGAASGGTVSKNGTWQFTGLTAAGSGTTMGHYRIKDSGGTTCHEQGTITAQVQIATSALTAANGNVLTFASTTGVSVGMNVSGTGVPTGATVVAVTGTTVTLSMTSTAGVSSATTITFGGDMTVDNVSIASGQVATINTFSQTIPNA